jgi:hypothetical protein
MCFLVPVLCHPSQTAQMCLDVLNDSDYTTPLRVICLVDVFLLHL